MKKIPVWKNLVLTFSIIAVAIVATFAWFYTGTTATVGILDVNVGEARYIQVSGDNGNSWSENFDMEIGRSMSFKEISGDGNSFFAPVYEFVDNPSGGSANQLVSFNQVNDNEFYYEQTLDLRGDTSQLIYLAPESSVTAVNVRDNCYIDGAIRVAFFELDELGNETFKFIWAPNSKVEYSAESNLFTREGNVEPYYYYQKSINPVDISSLEETNSDVAMISTEETDENGCGYNQEYKFMWSNGENLPSDAPSVLTLDTVGEDKLFYKSLKIKVWLEGYDRECVSLLSGQGFTMNLQFTAQEEE